ncbi:GNAT family N-acetyltransferase [Streptococcus cuniculi]|uniref:GNAT family N-acetyltransferase n=1 Tax=Streptococcus cuniculi TaxID=1432788 RepID=UPI001FC907F5|nr:GNAT family N-acetyltransferase [Streptococcus cuniculi]
MMVTLSLYHEVEHGHSLQAYSLSDSTHTDTPQNIIETSKKDRDRYPIAILDHEDGHLIGFFCLHVNAGPKEYGYYQQDYALVRGFSIDDNFRNQGYGSHALNDIFTFIDSTLQLEVNHIILAVNEKNILAQKAYKHSGFFVVKRDVEGQKGKLMMMEKKRDE